MTYPDATDLLYESGLWRRDSAAWTLSILLHMLLLLFKGVPYLIPQELPMPLSPVEISLTQEENVNPSPAAGVASENAGGGGGRSVLSRIKSVFKKQDPWEDFETSGPWDKAKPSSTSFVPKAAAGASGAKSSGGGDVALKMATADLAKISNNWKPTGNKAKPVQLSKTSNALDDSDDLGGPGGGGLSKSPWKAPRAGGSGPGGSELRGTGEGDMTNATASRWSTSGAGSKESRPEAEGSGSGLPGSRGGGGSNFYELRGPLSKRKVTYSIVPPYPDWAREKGFEATVTVYFTVLPDGRLKEPLIIKKSSGDPRIDALVIKTLKDWRFAALKTLQEEQWGLITFRFQLQ